MVTVILDPTGFHNTKIFTYVHQSPEARVLQSCDFQHPWDFCSFENVLMDVNTLKCSLSILLSKIVGCIYNISMD